MVGVEAVLVLELEVIIGRQEGQLDGLEEPLQVGLARRGDEGGLRPQRPLDGQGGVGGAHRGLEVHAVGVPVALLDLHHGAQRISTVGREGPTIEIDLAHEVGIDHPHDAARGALRGEVIDHGDLDAVEVEDVLRRPPAAHDQVIAVGIRSADPREGLHQLGDVAIRPRALLDLLEAEGLQREGTLGTLEEELGAHEYLLEARGLLAEGDVHEARLVAQHLQLGREGRLVADHTDDQAYEAWLDARDDEAPLEVCPSSELHALDLDGGEL